MSLSITIEGRAGTGRDTLAAALAYWLHASGYSVTAPIDTTVRAHLGTYRVPQGTHITIKSRQTPRIYS